ncbi:MAG: alpha/beta fold hydrolase [Gammaproteobacteria bacterium]|nr:alpha/beta fold hydrolase [Gammaproteobacteria bacterium]
MAKFKTGCGEIYFEHRGARADPRVLFVHGLGCQLVQWPDSLIDGIVDAGFCAVMFDNRDVGLSDGPAEPPPSVEALLAAQIDPAALTPAYTLSDMAGDVVALLDHLGQGGAHVIGLSMGGMISQGLAIEHPERVYSLTSIMSTTGNRELPGPPDEVVGALISTVTGADTETIIAQNIQAAKVFGGPHYDSEIHGIGRFARIAVERAHRPEGVMRQLGAILSAEDRRGALAELTVPTLVIHGNADPLVPVEAGRDTAAAIRGAKYLEIDRLGHDLPEPVIGDMVEAITAHLRAVEVSR